MSTVTRFRAARQPSLIPCSACRCAGYQPDNNNLVHLWVSMDIAPDVPPRQVRQRFAGAIRQAVARGYLAGRIDQAVAEELFRAIPEIV